MKNIFNFIKVLFASLLVFSSVAFINPTASHAQENLSPSEISIDDPIIQRAKGDQAYYNGLMIRYGVFNNDGVWSWSQGSFDHPIESLVYHYNEHGKEVGATSMSQYINKSVAFKTNLRGATVSKVNGKTPNVYRYKKLGKYIDIQKGSNLIVSFGR
ncbi:hypothetical protein ACFVEL_30125 [Bacillus thuringiensis]|uniref:hypothetical protein n=1 Tax=Bacillus thuringiensis TaxID=1428 RepID=UPI0036715C69